MKVLAALLLVVVGAQACAAGLSCTDVGGENGIDVTIPRSLYFASETAVVKVCDDVGCESTTERLPRESRDADSHGFGVSYEDLGRRFRPGRVEMTVTLTDSDGSVVAVAHREIELKRSYPNGKKCDGNRFLGGHFIMRARDRVSR